MEFLYVVTTLLLLFNSAAVSGGGMTPSSLEWTHINNPNSNVGARKAGLKAVRRHNGALLPGEVALTFCWVEEAKVKAYNTVEDEYSLTVAVRAAGAEGNRVADVKVVVLRGFPDIIMKLMAFLYKSKVVAGKVPSNEGEDPPNNACI